MARVRVGLTCEQGHFNYIGDVWEPAKDKDLDKIAERARVPVACEHRVGSTECGQPFTGLPHIEGREREGEGLARVGGRNVHAGLQSKPKARPKEGPLTPAEWKRRVFDRQRERPGAPALCAVTGEPLSFSADDAHHVIEKSVLRARGLHRVVWDERNGMAVKRRVHEQHTNRSKPIPRRFVPETAYQLAHELGPWAIARIHEKHPR